MSDGPSRLLALSVLGSAFHGKRVDVAAVDEVLIGSDPGCSLHIDYPGISPIHARLWVEEKGATVFDTKSPNGVFINFDRVEGEALLREGDMIWLGPPQEPGSVLIQCTFGVLHPGPIPLHTAMAVDLMADEPPPAPPAPMAAPPATPSAAFVIEESADIEGPPPAAPLALGFDEFLAPDTEAPEAPAAADFVVAGFEAEWPEVEATPVESSSAPRPHEDDPFFIGEAAAAPPPVAQAEDAFFIADDLAAVAPAAAPAALAAEVEPISFAADELFVEPAEPGTSAPEPPSNAPMPLPPLDLSAPPPAPAAPPAKPEPPAPPQNAAARAEPAPASPRPQKAEGPKPPPFTVPAMPAVRRPDSPPAAKRRTDPSPAPAAARRSDAPRTPARRPESSAGARPAARPARPASSPRPRGAPSPGPRYALIGGVAVAVALLAGLAFLVPRFLGAAAEVQSIEPARARIGQTVALLGKGFAAEAKANVVMFGDRAGTVLNASPERLEVVVPDVVTVAGQDVRMSVRVRLGRKESKAVELAVFAGPTVHGISPEVAMPGDEVVLAGVGWRPGATVSFGPQAAEVLEVRDTSIRVRVPPILGGPGTAAPVVVSVGGGGSNPAPFFIGRVPLVLKVDPPAAAVGEVVAIRGRGFQRDPQRNAVMIGGARALILSAFDDELQVVVPRVPVGDEARPVEVRTAGSENVGSLSVSVPSPPATADFRFVAEPFDAAYGKSHAVLATDLGPAFVLAASGGKTAAARAVEAERRLNEAANVLKATRGLNFEVRTADTAPALALSGRPELLLEVSEEDAAAYNEDWTGLRGRGGLVTRARLALWWEAVARDLVLILVRNERPQFAAALAAEGRVLVELFQAGQKGPLAVAAAKPATRDAVRILAFRVPAAIPGPAGPTSVAVAPAAAAGAPLQLQGAWIGTEMEADERRDLTATFRNGLGTMSYEGRVTLTVPFLTLEEPQKNTMRISLQVRGGMRFYNGRWDGQMLSGTVARDAAGKEQVGTFTLRPR
jgi:hypothetical protein